MKILVTGSSGTIGTRLCEKLLADGHDVIGVDRVPNKWIPEIDAITQRVDLLDEKAVSTLSTDVDMIVHLAANARVYELVEHPELAKENLDTTFNILEFARKNSIKKFLFASSRETYGNTGHDRYTEDLVCLESESPYTASKLAGEALVHAYQNCYGIDSIIFRFSNVYGMYDDSVRVVPLFIRQARSGETMNVFGKDKCLDFTYIDDTTDGISLAIEKFDAAKNDTYNIAFGEGTTIVRLAEMVKELTQSDSDIVVGEPRTGEIVRFVADISKAKKKLGYDPQISFEEGIEKAVGWYAEQA